MKKDRKDKQLWTTKRDGNNCPVEIKTETHGIFGLCELTNIGPARIDDIPAVIVRIKTEKSGSLGFFAHPADIIDIAAKLQQAAIEALEDGEGEAGREHGHA